MKPRFTLGFNMVDSQGNLGFQMSKDSDTGWSLHRSSFVYVTIGGFRTFNEFANDLQVYYCRQFDKENCTGTKIFKH
jgi:hypothetical protein